MRSGSLFHSTHRLFQPTKLIAFATVCLCLQSTKLNAQPVLFVNVNASGIEDGSDWTNAFTKLQDALAEANTRNTDGDGLNDISEIWVAAGTYKPDQGTGITLGDRTATFQLLNNVALYGGFNGTETLLSQRDIAANVTILSGDLNGNDTPLACAQDSPDCDSFGKRCIDGFCIIKQNNSENSFHVVTGSGTDATAVLDGFTITAGNANIGTIPNGRGAGMWNDTGSPTVSNYTFTGNSANAAGAGMFNEGGSPTLTNCAFSANSASSSGGGMLNATSNPTLTDCTFSGNTAANGGGMYNGLGSNPTLTNCTFNGNLTSSGGGGGMVNSNSNPTLTNCTFNGNFSDASGGGMINSLSSPTLTNCTFSGNTAPDGGGMSNSNSDNSTLTNCIFSGNFAVNGGGMFNSNFSSPTLTNCTFSSNTAFAGGGMYILDSTPTMTNCTFSGNSAGLLILVFLIERTPLGRYAHV